MSRLVVYLNRRRAGELAQAEDALPTFSYDQEYLSDTKATPLSRQLPLRPEVFSGGVVRAFFVGILPEADVRDQVAAILGVSPENDLGLMERIGGECAGAVSLLRSDAPPPPQGAGRLQWVSKEELADIIRELPRRPLMAGREGVRLSLAGAQSKLPIVFPFPGTDAEGVAALPLDGAASTHIIKPEPDRFPGLAANEAYCMVLARHVGLKASETQWKMIGGTPCLIVRRYDRTESSDGEVIRSHQEDFCQALGIPPERKYQQEGGPSLPDCFVLLREWSTLPVLDVREFLDAVTFGVLIGNADAHAKNFSFLYSNGQRRLAPLYDQVCTLAWPELSKTLSMKIGSASILPQVSPEHFQQLASKAGLGPAVARERLVGMCRRIVASVSDDTIAAPLLDSVNGIRTIIFERAERMLGLLRR
jgi:serine/threonine-protein kinase HipA